MVEYHGWATLREHPHDIDEGHLRRIAAADVVENIRLAVEWEGQSRAPAR
jgi:hypothetical protein